jgi:D-glutamate cyclase
MTTDEKLAAILAAVQTDPGNRGLARDAHDNLFTACPGDFAAACRSIADYPNPSVGIVTGFWIPTAQPPAPETDGPLGAVFLARALYTLRMGSWLMTEDECLKPNGAGLLVAGLAPDRLLTGGREPGVLAGIWVNPPGSTAPFTHLLALERVGPATDGRCYTMRGRDVTTRTLPSHHLFDPPACPHTIGIGDGGNEIGMGKIPHETIVKNIPNGDLIHCRVATDHLIVAGVSNWGAYALAAGVYILHGVKPPGDLFDPDREREILEVMVREGPLVDGVTGKQTATVDGLTWDEYVKPLVRIREILES